MAEADHRSRCIEDVNSWEVLSAVRPGMAESASSYRTQIFNSPGSVVELSFGDERILTRVEQIPPTCDLLGGNIRRVCSRSDGCLCSLREVVPQ